MRFRSVLQQGALALVTTNVVYLLNFLANVALVRMLSPDAFGILALAVAMAALVDMFTTFAPSVVLIQRRDSAALVQSVFQFSAGNALLKIALGSVVLAVGWSHYALEVWSIFAVIILSKVVMLFGTLLTARIEKSGLFFASSLVDGLSTLGGAVGALVAVWFGWGVYGLALRESLPAIFATLAMLILFPQMWPRRLARINKRQMRVVLHSASRLYFQRMTELGFARIPLLTMEALFGTTLLGLYSQALYLVTAVNRIMSFTNQQVATVYFAKHRWNVRETDKGFIVFLASTLVLAMPVTLLLGLIPEHVVLFLWNESWLGAVPFLRVMAALSFVLPLFTLVKSRLLGLRRNSAITVLYLMATAIFAGGQFLPVVGNPAYLLASLTLVSQGSLLVVGYALLKQAAARPMGEKSAPAVHSDR